MYNIRLMSLVCGVATLLADQWTKRVALTHWGLRLGKLVRFHSVPHRSNAYERPAARLCFGAAWILALLCALFLYRFSARFHTPVALAGLGLAFGGAAGNLIDILRRRCVVNFIDLGWWPVFNLADAAIVAGMAAAFLG
jgi:lipoprotein signal peptidase